MHYFKESLKKRACSTKAKTKKQNQESRNKKAKTKKQKHQRWRNRWLTAVITSLFFKEFRNVFYYF